MSFVDIISDAVDGVGSFIFGGEKDSPSLFNNSFFDFLGKNKEIASAALTTSASLIGGLYNAGLAKDQADFLKQKFEDELLLKEQTLDQQKELAELSASVQREAIGAQSAAAKRNAGLNLAIARSNVAGQAGQRQIDAIKDRPALIALGRQFQAKQASESAALGQQGFLTTGALATRGLG